VARWPATLMVPVRSEPVLGGAVKVMTLPPVPLVGGVSEIQLESVDAVQLQSVSDVPTVTVELPPLVAIV
jgi:hypothetical protein